MEPKRGWAARLARQLAASRAPAVSRACITSKKARSTRFPDLSSGALWLCVALSLQGAPVKQLGVFDAGGNELFHVVYDYDGGGRTLGCTVYDRGDYVLKRVAFTGDGTGYHDPFDNLIVHTSYVSRSGTTDFTIFDAYQKGGIGYRGTYSGVSGVYSFSNSSGLATHSLSYKYRSDGRIERINVRDASGELTHHVMVYYEGDNPVRAPLRSAVSRLLLSFDLAGRRSVALEIFDLLGKCVAVPLRKTFESGAHVEVVELRERAAGIRSGVWVVRLSAGETVLTRTIQVVK